MDRPAGRDPRIRAAGGGATSRLAQMRRVLSALVVDETAQDIVEYALLVALVALLTVGALTKFPGALNKAYVSWNTAMMRCWQMPEPGPGHGC